MAASATLMSLKLLVEVNPRGGGDSIGALAKEHLVQEERHDLFFAELLLDSIRKKRFSKFANERLLERQEVGACELLCQRTATAGISPVSSSDVSARSTPR